VQVLGLTSKSKTMLERLAIIKCSSLVGLFVSEEEANSFIRETPVANVIKLFTAVSCDFS